MFKNYQIVIPQDKKPKNNGRVSLLQKCLSDQKHARVTTFLLVIYTCRAHLFPLFKIENSILFYLTSKKVLIRLFRVVFAVAIVTPLRNSQPRLRMTLFGDTCFAVAWKQMLSNFKKSRFLKWPNPTDVWSLWRIIQSIDFWRLEARFSELPIKIHSLQKTWSNFRLKKFSLETFFKILKFLNYPLISADALICSLLPPYITTLNPSRLGPGSSSPQSSRPALLWPRCFAR